MDQDRTSETQMAEARRALRESVLLAADIAPMSDEPILQGRVRNVSATGALLELSAPLAVGTRVRLSFRGAQAVAATIMWAKNGRAGVAFDTPIDPALCRRSIKAPEPDPSRDWVLCLREPYRPKRW